MSAMRPLRAPRGHQSRPRRSAPGRPAPSGAGRAPPPGRRPPPPLPRWRAPGRGSAGRTAGRHRCLAEFVWGIPCPILTRTPPLAWCAPGCWLGRWIGWRGVEYLSMERKPQQRPLHHQGPALCDNWFGCANHCNLPARPILQLTYLATLSARIKVCFPVHGHHDHLLSVKTVSPSEDCSRYRARLGKGVISFARWGQTPRLRELVKERKSCSNLICLQSLQMLTSCWRNALFVSRMRSCSVICECHLYRQAVRSFLGRRPASQGAVPGLYRYTAANPSSACTWITRE